APKGRRRTYDVSRDTLTGCSSRGNVGLPRGELRVLCCRLRPAERAHFPLHAPSMLVSGSDWRNEVRNRHLRCKIPSRTCLHWVDAVEKVGDDLREPFHLAFYRHAQASNCPRLDATDAQARHAAGTFSHGPDSVIRRWRLSVRLPESGQGWAIYEYTPFCNGPGDVKSPRVIVASPSSRFCPWSTLRPPHCAVRGSGEPI